MNDIAEAEPSSLKTGQSYEFLYWVLMLASGSIVYLSFCFATYWICHENPDDISRGYRTAALGCAASLLPFLIAFFYYQPRAFLTAQLFQDRFLIDRDGKQTQAGLHEVTRVSLAWLPVVGNRLMLQLKDGSRIRISITLMGLSGLVAALEMSNPALLTPRESASLHRKLQLADFRAARAWEYLRQGRRLLVRHLLFPVVFGVLLPNAIKYLTTRDLSSLPWVDVTRQLLEPLVLAIAAAGAIWLVLAAIQRTVLALHDRRQPPQLLARDEKFEKSAGLLTAFTYYSLTTACYAAAFLYLTGR